MERIHQGYIMEHQARDAVTVLLEGFCISYLGTQLVVLSQSDSVRRDQTHRDDF